MGYLKLNGNPIAGEEWKPKEKEKWLGEWDGNKWARHGPKGGILGHIGGG